MQNQDTFIFIAQLPSVLLKLMSILQCGYNIPFAAVKCNSNFYPVINSMLGEYGEETK